MPAVNPRITVTLQPQVHAILRELSRLTGNSQSALIAELLLESVPVFERMTTVLQAAEQLKQQGVEARGEITRSLDRAQARIEQQLGLVLDDMDEGVRPVLEQAERVARRRGRADGDAARRAPPDRRRSASTPLSNRGVRSPQQKARKARKESV